MAAKKRPVTPIEMKEVKEKFKEIGKLFSKIGGAVNKPALERASNIEGFPEVQNRASELYHELDKYERICSRDPGLYNRWKTAKQNLLLVATYKKL